MPPEKMFRDSDKEGMDKDETCIYQDKQLYILKATISLFLPMGQVASLQVFVSVRRIILDWMADSHFSPLFAASASFSLNSGI